MHAQCYSRCPNILSVRYRGHLTWGTHLGGHGGLESEDGWRFSGGVGDGGGVSLEGFDAMSSESTKGRFAQKELKV